MLRHTVFLLAIAIAGAHRCLERSTKISARLSQRRRSGTAMSAKNAWAEHRPQGEFKAGLLPFLLEHAMMPGETRDVFLFDESLQQCICAAAATDCAAVERRTYSRVCCAGWWGWVDTSAPRKLPVVPWLECRGERRCEACVSIEAHHYPSAHRIEAQMNGRPRTPQ